MASPKLNVAIDFVDKGILSSFFNNGGYVLDFTTEGLDRFSVNSVGVPICAVYKLSKGKSLATFVNVGEKTKVLKLFDDLVRYYEDKWAEELQQNTEKRRQLEKLKQVLDKYRDGGNVSVSIPAVRKITGSYVRDIATRSMQDVENGDFDSALTKARTLVEETFCYVIELKGLEPDKSGDIRRKYAQVKNMYNMHGNKDVDKRINELLSGLEKILTAITEMRNGLSDAHGVGSRRINIKSHHARLFVNSAQTMADFILAVSDASRGAEASLLAQ